MRDLRTSDSQLDYAYEFTYTFSPTDTPRTDSERVDCAFITDTNNRTITDELAWEEFAGDRDISVEQAQDDWTVISVTVMYHDPPWDDHDTLVDDLRDLPHVTQARYEGTFDGSYGPARVHLHIDPGTMSAVRKAVNDYYAPLTVQAPPGPVCTVVVSPTMEYRDTATDT